MSSWRNVAAIASLPQTRDEGGLGTGRSISLPAASIGLAGASSMVSSLTLADDYAAFLRREQERWPIVSRLRGALGSLGDKVGEERWVRRSRSSASERWAAIPGPIWREPARM